MSVVVSNSNTNVGVQDAQSEDLKPVAEQLKRPSLLMQGQIPTATTETLFASQHSLEQS